VADTIIGGAGDDTFVMTSSTAVGSGTVDGMAVNLSDAAVTQASIFTGSARFLSGAATAGLAANTATDLFSNESGTNASIVDTLSGIENVTTGTGRDYVVGSSVTNVISTGDGIDWISGGDGSDYMSADGAGDGGDIDRVIGGTGDDTYVYSDAGGVDVYIEAASAGYDTILVNGNLSIATLTVGTTATAAGAVGSLSNFEQIVIGTGNTATVIGAQVTGLTLNVTEVAAGTSTLVVTATAGGTTDLSKLTFSSGTYVGSAGTVLAGNALTSGTDLVKINGGGAETIVAASIATVIDAGAGIDTITLGAGNDRIILDQITNANREDITGFSTSGDILVLDRSALATLGSADDVIDAAEINVSAAGVKTAAADIIVLTDGVARTAAQVETLLQGVYVAGGASGAGAVAVVYLSSVTNALVVAYDANIDVGTDGTGMITIANLVGLVGADLANITAADFAFQA
jgi:hypothetical protein